MKKLVWVGKKTEYTTPGKKYKIIFMTDETVKFQDDKKFIALTNPVNFITKKEAKKRYTKTDFYVPAEELK